MTADEPKGERPLVTPTGQRDAWNEQDQSNAGPFGPFCLISTDRLLLEQNEPTTPDERVRDLLIALVERTGPALAAVCGL